MKKFFYIFIVLIFAFRASASNDDSTHVKKNSMLNFFRDGHIGGQIRNFSMATFNQGELTDYYANAIGARIHYSTATFKGFSFGLKGIFIHKLFSNDLNLIDPKAEQSSRYEKQLFDVEHPNNYNDLDRLEELYINYSHQGFSATVGKMELTTPLVNPHDGRMKPKVFSGIWLEQKINDSTKINLGWFSKASPRSTTHWYGIGESIGIYNNGCLPIGVEADYHGFISSKGLGIIGASTKPHRYLTAYVWNYFLENVSNTIILKLEFNKPNSLFAGAMFMNQSVIKNGGSNNLIHTFHPPTEGTNVISTRIGYEINKYSFSLNGTWILNTGKYLFPREFGVDPFYTFISRSQLEGLGDAKAIDLNLTRKVKELTVKIDLVLVHAPENLELNKYNLPSYNQYNLDVKYKFKNKLKGLDLRFLYVFRNAIGEITQVKRQFNKTDFHQFNLITNFNF